MTDYDVAVIGGGQAGLAMGHELAAAGLDFVILDAGDAVGHVWRARWTSLRLFTPARYAALPGLPFPAEPDSYPGKDQVADYLATYATTCDLPIRLRSPVTALTAADNGFALTTPGEPVHAHQVVVTTGPFQVPVVPACAAAFAPEVLQQHSSEYRDPATGAVTMAIGTRNVCIPQRVLGQDLFWWQTHTGLITAPAAATGCGAAKVLSSATAQGPSAAVGPS